MEQNRIWKLPATAGVPEITAVQNSNIESGKYKLGGENKKTVGLTAVDTF